MAQFAGPPDPAYILRGSKSSVTSLNFPGLSSEVLFSGNQDGQVHIWNMKTRRIQSEISAHPERSVLWIDFLGNGQMVTQGRDGLVKCWTQTESEWLCTGSLKACDHGFCASTLLKSSENKLSSIIAIPSEKVSCIDIHDCSTFKLQGSLEPHLQHEDKMKKLGMCMAIKLSSKNGFEIVAGYEDGSIALWDIRTYKMMDRFFCHTESVMCLDFCLESRRGLSGSVDDILRDWSVSSENKLLQQDTCQIKNPGFNQILIRHDKKIVAVAGWDKKVRIFGWKKLKPLAVIEYHKDSVQSLAFSNDNSLACGSKDNHISLWDIYK